MEKIDAEIAEVHTQMKPLQNKLNRLHDKKEEIRKQRAEENKDNFEYLLKDTGAWAEMREFCPSGVSPSGYVPSTMEQHFDLWIETEEHLENAEQFITKYLPQMTLLEDGTFDFPHQYFGYDSSSAGLEWLVTDGDRWFLVFFAYGRVRTQKEMPSLRAALEEILNR